MSNNWSNLGQSFHLHLNDIRRHITLHLHVDTAHRMHRHIHNCYDFRNMLTEGQLFDQ